MRYLTLIIIWLCWTGTAIGSEFRPFLTQGAARPSSSPGTHILVPIIVGNDIVAEANLVTDGTDGNYRLEVEELRDWIQENLSDTAEAEFENIVDENGTIAVETHHKAGIALHFDEENIAIRLVPRPESLESQSLSLEYDASSLSQELVKPSDVSAFMNFRGGQDYIHNNPTLKGRQPARLDVDGAVNIASWVLEGRGDYLERDDRPWQRGDVRIIHDLPDKMVRLAAGDLSYPVTDFQSFQPMLGLSIARNFTLQPYRVTEPTGRTSFVLQSPSRVDIYVNGQRVRTLQLEPGPYDVSDFPVADGSNDVRLLITDATGRREEKRFSLLSNQRLLREGLHEYAYNFGIESENTDRKIEYDSAEPAFSAFHRYGFSDVLTGAASLQASTTEAQAGLSALNAFEWGTVGLETAASDSKNLDSDVAGRLSYSYQNIKDEKNFSSSAQYRGKNFASLGQEEANQSSSWEFAANYSQPIFYEIDLSVGGRYTLFEEAMDNEWSYTANFNRMLTPSLSLNVNFQHQSEQGAGVFAGLTWIPLNSDHMYSASIDTLSKTRDARWDWHDGRHWQVGAGVTQEDHDLSGTGNIGYMGQRAEANLRHEIASTQSPFDDDQSQTDQRTQTRFGTALAFADGHVALSRPINEGFVMLTRHDNLTDHLIGVNPESGDDEDIDYQAEIDFLGPAVIPDATPYLYRPIKVDTRNLPIGYDVGMDNFVALPGYKSGTLVNIGNAANIYADGYIIFPGGKPLMLQAGLIKSLSDPNFAEQEFFTNDKGRFRITQLEPGQYEISLYAYPGQTLSLSIPDGSAIGRYDAGTLTMQETAP